MRKIWLLPGLVVASAATSESCELSLRDQVLLIEMGQELIAPSSSKDQRLERGRVECAEVSPLFIVRHPSAVNAYIFDPRRVFSRWSATGRALDGDLDRVVRVYLKQYSAADRWTWWKEYGTGPLKVPRLPETTTLQWHELRLISRTEFDSAKSEVLQDNDQEFIERLMRDRIRAYLSANLAPEFQIQEFIYAPISPNDGKATVSLRTKRAGVVDTLSVIVPVNPSMSPFVGYPQLE